MVEVDPRYKDFNPEKLTKDNPRYNLVYSSISNSLRHPKALKRKIEEEALRREHEAIEESEESVSITSSS